MMIVVMCKDRVLRAVGSEESAAFLWEWSHGRWEKYRGRGAVLSFRADTRAVPATRGPGKGTR